MDFEFAIGEKVKINFSKNKEKIGRIKGKAQKWGTIFYLVGDTWYDECDVKPIESFHKETLVIDPYNPTEAREKLEKVLKSYQKFVPQKPTSWTEEEITLAQEISKERIYALAQNGAGVQIHFHRDGTISGERIWNHEVAVKAKAALSEKDIYNRDIGICVVFCKLTCAKVPDFILQKNKQRKKS